MWTNLESAGLVTQCLVCCVMPPPQLLEHAVHGLHADHTPTVFGVFFSIRSRYMLWTLKEVSENQYRLLEQDKGIALCDLLPVVMTKPQFQILQDYCVLIVGFIFSVQFFNYSHISRLRKIYYCRQVTFEI
jgi:hypothetical protein